jgi:hypothetical protein
VRSSAHFCAGGRREIQRILFLIERLETSFASLKLVDIVDDPRLLLDAL